MGIPGSTGILNKYNALPIVIRQTMVNQVMELHMESYTSRELVRFIEVAGESINIDAKGPIKWDSGEAAARLTKDIIAFAACR